MTIYIRTNPETPPKLPLFFWFPLWLFPSRILAKYALKVDPKALRNITRELRRYRRQNGRLTLMDVKSKEGDIVRIKM